jgi:hypothetical protein
MASSAAVNISIVARIVKHFLIAGAVRSFCESEKVMHLIQMTGAIDNAL